MFNWKNLNTGHIFIAAKYMKYLTAYSLYKRQFTLNLYARFKSNQWIGVKAKIQSLKQLKMNDPWDLLQAELSMRTQKSFFMSVKQQQQQQHNNTTTQHNNTTTQQQQQNTKVEGNGEH